MIRIAEIDGKFYPYSFSLRTAQVTLGDEFGLHNEFGIRYVSRPYDTLEQAKKTFIKYRD
jgi:hypothetical protein